MPENTGEGVEMTKLVSESPHPPVPIPNSRQRILELAVSAIERGGESAIRVNDIARESGVAVTSLYHYFGNREGLVAAAQIARYRRITTEEFVAVQQMAEQCANLHEFRQLMELWILRFLNSPENVLSRNIRLQTYAAAITRPDIATLLAEDQELQGERMHAFLEPLKARGWIKPDVDTRTFGSYYLGVMMGHVQYEVGRPRVDIEAWKRFTLNAIMQIVPEDN